MLLSTAEKIARSKSALIIVLLLVVSGLSAALMDERKEHKTDRAEFKEDLAKKDSVIYCRDIALDECKKEKNIMSDNAIKAEQYRSEKYEKLYLEVVSVRKQVERKKVIK